MCLCESSLSVNDRFHVYSSAHVALDGGALCVRGVLRANLGIHVLQSNEQNVALWPEAVMDRLLCSFSTLMVFSEQFFSFLFLSTHTEKPHICSSFSFFFFLFFLFNRGMSHLLSNLCLKDSKTQSLNGLHYIGGIQ